tara:strand:+ start:411 stop:980 length:570 start_codon:yes stop_codon:yes gene_type:complete
MTSKCDLENTNVIYYYTCKDISNNAVTNGSTPWCEVANPPPQEVMTNIKIQSFRDLNPSESTTNMNPDNFKCEVVATPVQTHSKIERERMAGLKRGMARSCHPMYNVNDAEIKNDFTCWYNGLITDEQGRKGTHPFKSVSGSLFSCDMGLDITDELMADIKMSAYMQAHGDTAGLNVADFACSVMSVPR